MIVNKRTRKPTKLYVLKSCCADLDWDKVENFRGKAQLLSNLRKIKEHYKIPLDRIFFIYVGSTTIPVRERMHQHLSKKSSPMSLFKVLPEIIHEESIGDLDYEEGEFYEELYLESFEIFWAKCFNKDEGVFYWPMGPFKEEDRGRAQTEHPYPDNNIWPRWYRKYVKEQISL